MECMGVFVRECHRYIICNMYYVFLNMQKCTTINLSLICFHIYLIGMPNSSGLLHPVPDPAAHPTEKRQSFGLPPQIHVPTIEVLRIRSAQWEANARTIAGSICLGDYQRQHIVQMERLFRQKNWTRQFSPAINQM